MSELEEYSVMMSFKVGIFSYMVEVFTQQGIVQSGEEIISYLEDYRLCSSSI
jgi:hypothetical protein